MMRFCDKEPCSHLKESIIKLIPDSKKLGSSLSLEFLVITEQKYLSNDCSPERVKLIYCPFCGTRLWDNPDILSWAEKFWENKG